LCDREDFGVSGRIANRFHLVVSRGDDLALELDHRANRHLIRTPRVDRTVVSHAHEERVVAHQTRWMKLLERAGDLERAWIHGRVAENIDLDLGVSKRAFN
jgi:hypothetical protein